MSRAAIARYYYAMYHAMRAAAFEFHKGDDHEQHSVLSQRGIPDDYPKRALAANTLKDARTLRNEADYEPYPAATTYYRKAARALGPVASTFVAEARSYVVSKGNPYA